MTSSDVVHHKDGNILNNDPDNLEIMSRTEHARMHGRETLTPAKLTPDRVRQIRRFIGVNDLTNEQVGAVFGVAKETIRDLRSGHTWAWVT